MMGFCALSYLIHHYSLRLGIFTRRYAPYPVARGPVPRVRVWRGTGPALQTSGFGDIWVFFHADTPLIP